MWLPQTGREEWCGRNGRGGRIFILGRRRDGTERERERGGWGWKIWEDGEPNESMDPEKEEEK